MGVENMIKEFFNGIFWLIIFLLTFYLVLNGIFYISCLASEGEPYINKIVYACHFEEKDYNHINQQIITTSSQECFLNGKQINCTT